MRSPPRRYGPPVQLLVAPAVLPPYRHVHHVPVLGGDGVVFVSRRGGLPVVVRDPPERVLGVAAVVGEDTDLPGPLQSPAVVPLPRVAPAGGWRRRVPGFSPGRVAVDVSREHGVPVDAQLRRLRLGGHVSPVHAVIIGRDRVVLSHGLVYIGLIL
ncbi:hypothetical protein PG996_006367 [Apiospora saccharicola]|uniref:Uncharacterized protein n=1 Tax=Apiospora saccharicola TaxID=335842 RepID=A0ABR1VP41_9PEZI